MIFDVESDKPIHQFLPIILARTTRPNLSNLLFFLECVWTLLKRALDSKLSLPRRILRCVEASDASAKFVTHFAGLEASAVQLQAM